MLSCYGVTVFRGYRKQIFSFNCTAQTNETLRMRVREFSKIFSVSCFTLPVRCFSKKGVHTHAQLVPVARDLPVV